METYFIHLLKSCGVLLLFMGCYLMFLKRETFFNGNRWFLLAGVIFSIVAPYITFTHTVYRDAALNLDLLQYTTHNADAMALQTPSINWLLLIAILYIIGVVFFSGRLLAQFLSIKKLIRTGKLVEDHPYYHVRTPHQISPFSFFRYIFYHKGTFDQKELQSVITHEKVHARQYHSVDILIMELILIACWFNPFVWWYRNCVKQNLEFLADAESCAEGEGKKFYQYLMLKQVLGPHRIALANPFYNSMIKKRIVMLNQNHSNKNRMLKMLLILPAVTVFLVGFNTNTVYTDENPEVQTSPFQSEDRSVQIIINKDTSDEELKRIKKDMAKKGIDFSYTVVHNAKGEIIDIAIQISGEGADGENFSGNYNSSSASPIKPIMINYDSTSNMVSFGSASYQSISVHPSADHDNDIKINVVHDVQEGSEVHEEINHDVDVSQDNDVHYSGNGENSIDVRNATKTQKEGIKIRKQDQHDLLEIDGHPGNVLLDHDGEGEPLYYIDGKKASKEEVEQLSTDQIETIEVSKGEGAIKKYGKKAKYGVVEVTTKEFKP
nr:M56 family metallopeptidase [Allomuricauda sp.]